MPELPEVLTTIHHLKGAMVNRVIQGVWLNPEYRGAQPGTLVDQSGLSGVTGSYINDITNKAKYILFSLGYADYCYIVVHLGLTGSFFFGDHPGAVLKFTLRPESSDPAVSDLLVVSLLDPRRFSKVWAGSSALLQQPRWSTLGPTYMEFLKLGQDFEFAPGYYRQKPGSSLYEALLDQHLISGCGNIYACESLWACGLHPLTLVRDTTDTDLEFLAYTVSKKMFASIEAGGCTISDFKAPTGEDGRYAAQLKVFKKAGEPCPRCGGRILRKELSGRGCYGCFGENGCQLLKT